MNIPKEFKFRTTASSLDYHAIEVSTGGYLISWYNGSVGYKRREVFECLRDGIWIINDSKIELTEKELEIIMSWYVFADSYFSERGHFMGDEDEELFEKIKSKLNK